MIRFHWVYFLGAVGLLLLEIWIAVAVHDTIIRPYGGDALATILLFCLAKSFLSLPTRRVAVAALLVSYLIEGLQYVHLLHYVGLENYRLARIVFGSSFAWIDMLAYTLGALAILLVERILTAFRGFHTLPA